MSQPLQTALKERLLTFAATLADTARAETMPLFRRQTAIDNKLTDGAFDPVTEADRNGEAAVRALIEKNFPEHDIDGEEYGRTDKGHDFCWVLDPVDGTRAFISGLPSWGTLIALRYQGEPLIGIIDHPALDERYIGDGEAASLNGKPIGVRPCADIGSAVLTTTDPYLFSGPAYDAFTRLKDQVKLVRYGLDCYGYAVVSAGHMDLVLESGLATYDRMALIPVLRGAGAKALDWQGNPAGDSDQLLAVGDPRLVDPVLDLLAG